MNKSCAKCSKTVYPIEELKCLDKIWHKGCFKCHECGMTLNMKTYKGFNKMPYCEAHIPKAKATTVADTPEMKRIQENTKIQSNAAYHAEFEKSKGKFTTVTDDPELLRLKGNTKIISNVTYHGDLEKKAVMETKRNLTGDGSQSDSGRGSSGDTNGASPISYMDEISSLPISQPAVPPQQRYAIPPPQQQQQQHHQQPQPPQQTRPANNYYGGDGPAHNGPPPPQQQYNHHSSPQHQNVMMSQGGNANANSPYSSRGAPTVVYSSSDGPVNMNASRKVGSIADYDPVNNFYGSLDPQRTNNTSGQQVTGRIGTGVGGGTRTYNSNNMNMTQGGGGGMGNPGMPQQMHQQQQHHQQPPPQHQGTRMMIPTHNDTSAATNNLGVCYRALYDYEAQDNDEISFNDGDLIINCTGVDEGWMTGTCQRNGKRGMLPANYVTPVIQN